MATYDKIHTGMSYMEVALLVGRDGVQEADSDLGGIRTRAYMWKSEKCCGYMTAVFQNGALTMKAQAELE
jgi:hypothetical protein